MYRRDALQTILAGMTGARVLALPPGSKGRAVDEGINTLFPTNLPSREWRQFRAHGLSTPACGVIFRRDRPPEYHAAGRRRQPVSAKLPPFTRWQVRRE